MTFDEVCMTKDGILELASKLEQWEVDDRVQAVDQVKMTRTLGRLFRMFAKDLANESES